MAVSSKQISDLFSLIFRGFLLLLLPLCRPIGDVVQAGPDARQVQERARRLLHLLVVALGGLLRAPGFFLDEEKAQKRGLRERGSGAKAPLI